MHPSGKFALFEATVDAGTYIRTLCDDIGKTCGGARMEELRRIRVGRLDEKNTYSMQDLLDATWFWKNRNDPSLLLRMIKKPDLFIELPKVHIKTSALESLLSGAQIMAPALESVPKTLRLGSRVMLYCDDTFIGIGVMVVDSKEAEKMKKGQIIKIERMHAQRK
jgi:predicted RNA-binding protein (TIGR00451 family)